MFTYTAMVTRASVAHASIHRTLLLLLSFLLYKWQHLCKTIVPCAFLLKKIYLVIYKITKNLHQHTELKVNSQGMHESNFSN